MNRLQLLLTFSFILLVSSCSADQDIEVQEQETPVVEVIEASKSELTESITYASNLEPWKQVNIASNAPGRIAEIFVEEGDTVESGDRLVRMQDTQLQQARIAYETAKREFERLEPLYEQGAVTQQQLDLAQTEFENAQINLELLEENTLLNSTIDGVVTAKWFEEGEFYLSTPTESGSPGIVQIMQLNPLKLVVNINESQLPYIKKGEPVHLTVDAFPNEEFESEVNRVFPTVDPNTRTFRVEVTINNDNYRLKPGMFARATIETRSHNALFVPREALIRGTSTNSQDVLFIIDEDNTVVRQVVKVGIFIDESVAIEDGVQPGQHVVVKGKQRIENGMKVQTEFLNR